MSPKAKKESKKDIIIVQLQNELDKERKFSQWLQYFSSFIYNEDRKMYDRASNMSYELLKINQEGEEADDRRKEILEQESKQTVGGKKDSKSGVDDRR